jgi:hypothetical protein
VKIEYFLGRPSGKERDAASFEDRIASVDAMQDTAVYYDLFHTIKPGIAPDSILYLTQTSRNQRQNLKASLVKLAKYAKKSMRFFCLKSKQSFGFPLRSLRALREIFSQF